MCRSDILDVYAVVSDLIFVTNKDFYETDVSSSYFLIALASMLTFLVSSEKTQ